MTERRVPEGWSSAELERVDSCPACASVRSAAGHDELRDEMEGVAGSWSMRRCLDCGSFYLDVRPRLDAIGKAYASYHTHAEATAPAAGDNGSSLLWRWSNGYMNARYGTARTPASPIGRLVLPLIPPLRQQLDYFYRHLPVRPGRLLDVGCGNGVFLMRAREAGWTVQGIEPDPKAAASARRAGLEVIEGTLDNGEDLGLFDAVTASHVIEHVHDPRLFFRQVFERLRPGGRLWLATPNVESLGHRRYGRAWRGLEPPRHMTVFSLPALRRLLDDAGFVQVEARRRGRGSRYILQSSAEVARRYGMSVRPLSAGLVDLLASMAPSLSEECVMTAVRSGH